MLSRGNRKFHGNQQRSVTKGLHPKEVGFVRKMGVTAGEIDPKTGDVFFKDRGEERRFDQQFADMAERLGGQPDPFDGPGPMTI